MASLIEKFTKYIPDEKSAEWMRKTAILSLRADKARRIVEVSTSFSELVEKSEIYRVEQEICTAYEYNVVKILPKYPAELFSYDYVPQILFEAERIGIVARGFFGYYSYKLENGVLTISIPFTFRGVEFVKDAKFDRFGAFTYSPEEGTAVLVTVYDNVQLSMVRSLLEAESIPYLIRERGSGSAVKIVMGVSSFGSDVYVPASKLEEATDAIAALLGEEVEFIEDGEGD